MNEEITCYLCKNSNFTYRDAKADYFVKSIWVDDKPIRVHAVCKGHYGLHNIYNWKDISIDEYFRYKKLQVFT